MPRIIFHRAKNLHFGITQDMPGIIDAIKELHEEDPQINLESKEITLTTTDLEQPVFPSGILADEEFYESEELKFTQENEPKVVKILEEIALILKDPNRVFNYLKDLDCALGEKMEEHGIELPNNHPQYLISSFGNFVPGPWPENYKPLKKEKILNQILLERERAAGINLDGIGVFQGFVGNNHANEFVKDGHIFSEDEQRSKFLFHGKYTHRLFFELLRQAAKCGEIDLSVDGEELTQKQLIQIMIFTWSKSSGFSTWASLLDSSWETHEKLDKLGACDEESYRARALNPDNYCFGSRSPFVFKSLLTCLGGDEIPNISRYLLDGHYKQVARMVYKIRGEDESGILARIPDEFIYTCCMDAMSTGVEFRPEDVSYDFPFLTSSMVRKTEPFGPRYVENIRRKIDGGNPVGSTHSYESIRAYASHKLSESPSKSK